MKFAIVVVVVSALALVAIAVVLILDDRATRSKRAAVGPTDSSRTALTHDPDPARVASYLTAYPIARYVTEEPTVPEGLRGDASAQPGPPPAPGPMSPSEEMADQPDAGGSEDRDRTAG